MLLPGAVVKADFRDTPVCGLAGRRKHSREITRQSRAVGTFTVVRGSRTRSSVP